MPILMILFMGIIDVALMFNAFVGRNRGSQNGADVAATLGPQARADHIILSEIESDVTVPNNVARIQWVGIELTSLSGNVPSSSSGGRTGSHTCTPPDSRPSPCPTRGP